MEFGQRKIQDNNAEDVKDKELWVELQRLYEPDPSDRHWRLEAQKHKIAFRKLHDSSEVHQVSTDEGKDLFMFLRKEYPLSAWLLTMVLTIKLTVDKVNDKARELLL